MLKKLFKLFTPQDESVKNNLSQNEQSENPNKVDNIIDLQYNLINKIVEYFKPYYGISEFTNTIVIWVSDQRIKSIVMEKTFEIELRKRFEDAELDHISNSSIVFKDSEPPLGNSFKGVVDGIFIEIEKKKDIKNEVVSKAKISIANKQGSLVKKLIKLDGDKQKSFNIGRGNGENGHINHIVISNDDDTQKENNNFVSRMHARILYIDNAGFYLQALKGGARNSGGSATKIIRNNEVIRIEDIAPKTLLNDGDLIELGKAVLLKYEVIKQLDKA